MGTRPNIKTQSDDEGRKCTGRQVIGHALIHVVTFAFLIVALPLAFLVNLCRGKQP